MRAIVARNINMFAYVYAGLVFVIKALKNLVPKQAHQKKKESLRRCAVLLTANVLIDVLQCLSGDNWTPWKSRLAYLAVPCDEHIQRGTHMYERVPPEKCRKETYRHL